MWGGEEMLKIRGKGGCFIWLLIYGIHLFLWGVVIVLSIAKPQHNLFLWQMAVGTALGAGLLLAAFWLWDRVPFRKMKRDPVLYAALLIAFGVLLYAASCVGRNDPTSFYDYVRVWNAAAELSEGGSLSEEWYFKLNANNIKPMLYLSALFRMAHFLGVKDAFYVVLLAGVLEVVGGVVAAGILVGNSREECEEMRIPVLLMFVFTLPIWANVQAFYTDGMSFFVGIAVLALLKLGMGRGADRNAAIFPVFAGLIFGIGVTVKVTVWIPVIAGFIVFCFRNPSGRQWKMFGLFLGCSMTVYAGTNLWAGKHEIWNEAKETAKPIEHFIALGLKGNGSYADNQEYNAYSDALPTKREKAEYARRYIKENYSEFWNPSHLTGKVRHNFASGSLGTKDYASVALKENNPIWEMFSPWGKHYWRTSQICFCYLFAMYACYLAGGIATFRSLSKQKAIPAVKAIADLALTGNILFLMIWEANNRQLYNQTPVILLGAVLNIRYIFSEFFDVR